MNGKDLKIHIVGAGVSGLIAAKVLEDHGYFPVVIESTDRAGGRVKTDSIDGFQLDHGFQVLLSKYPAAQKYLDFDALEIQKLNSGAIIFINGQQKIIGDPLRDITVFFSTLFSPIGSLFDKFKIFQLNFLLKNKSLHDIFKTEEITTKQYLLNFGFSKQIIANFFQPFFTGIFLETELKTSSRMFEFVFKMFSEGMAVIPKGGIEEISKQLVNNLSKTTFKFKTEVTEVSGEEIQTLNGDRLKTDATIIATDADKLIKNPKRQDLKWKSCQTLYFTSKHRTIKKSFIGLLSSKNSLVNNIFYHTSLKSNTTSKDELLSVTVVEDHNLSDKELVTAVTNQLKAICNIQELQFLKMYHIPKALPDLNDLKYEVVPAETQLTSTVFLAGDVQLNGSLNAAMIAGEKAALAVIEKFRSAGI